MSDMMSWQPQACFFPILDTGLDLSTENNWQSVEVPIRNISHLDRFCKEHEISPLTLFKLAWAIVLQCYTDSNSPSFGHLTLPKSEQGANSESPCNLSNIRNCHVELEGTGCMIEVLRAIQAASLENGGSHLVPYPGSKSANTSLLSTTAATNVAHTCAKAVDCIVNDPFRPVDNLDLITNRDLEQLREWEASFPERIDVCVHDLVLRHATSTPNSPAICSWDGQLTYDELEKATSTLACHLIDHGIEPEMLVPICFEKSLYAILTMLAILRIGGAFVPLDPSQPKERLESIIRKVNAKMVISSPQIVHKFSDITKQTISISEALLETLQVSLQDRLPIKVKPYSAAFVLFTSGSTGEPKGIVQEHSSVSTGSLAHGEAMGVNPRSRVLQYAAYTFDVSMMDIFITLIYGGCVCSPSEDDRRNNIIGIMNTMQVNWVLFTPSVANLIWPEDVPGLEALVLGGEAVTQENVLRWANAVTLYNTYGPAECGATTLSRLKATSRGSTIGRAFRSAVYWLVDPRDHNRLVPVGAVGELLVEGPTLARGYIGDIDKTKTVFIKDPRWPLEILGTRTRRFYKTGDLVRYNSDGTLEFVGRKDFQVKIRGQRVELGDVECHLSTYPGISLSMATSPKTGAFAKSLVAIIQIRDANLEPDSNTNILSLVSNRQLALAGFDIANLEQFLKTKLPNYMVPNHWFAVKRIPLSISGKINRKSVELWLTQLSRDSASPILSIGQNGTSLSKENIIASKISSKLASLIYNSDTQAKPKLIDQDITLTAIGLDSIQIISLIMFIKKEFTVKLHIGVLLHPKSTIRSVIQYIEELRAVGATHSVEKSVDLRTEFQMYKQQMAGKQWGRGPSVQNVFLTGGTGFLGSEILFQLCTRNDIEKIMVHVRAKNSKDGLQRIQKTAIRSGWWSDSYLEKIEVWPGDLGKRRLGLNSDQWDCLTGKTNSSRRVHGIVHCGAKVHWSSDFSSLKAANVDSTWILLNIVNETPSILKFVYISGGYNGPSLAEKHLHMNDVPSNNILPTEYAKTKFLSQLLVQEYSQTSIQNQSRVSVVKPSFIIGTAQQGIANTDDFIWRLVASCIEIGSFNEADADSWLFISDVGNVAKIVLDCCDTKHNNDSSSPHVGIIDGLPVREFWSILGRDFGYIIKPLSQEEWLDAIHADIDSRHDSHPLWPLIHNLEKEQGKMGVPVYEIPQELKVGTPLSRVEAAIRKNVEYLRGVGFLPTSNEY
ncbi:hypothetical protein NHQ30_008685 [Ciborinia camelliae]|nr:hypothetical protein NHQ30_008685 [Ciborinia camelliae]